MSLECRTRGIRETRSVGARHERSTSRRVTGERAGPDPVAWRTAPRRLRPGVRRWRALRLDAGEGQPLSLRGAAGAADPRVILGARPSVDLGKGAPPGPPSTKLAHGIALSGGRQLCPGPACLLLVARLRRACRSELRDAPRPQVRRFLIRPNLSGLPSARPRCRATGDQVAGERLPLPSGRRRPRRRGCESSPRQRNMPSAPTVTGEGEPDSPL